MKGISNINMEGKVNKPSMQACNHDVKGQGTDTEPTHLRNQGIYLETQQIKIVILTVAPVISFPIAYIDICFQTLTPRALIRK
jgi:hypothetical protein